MTEHQYDERDIKEVLMLLVQSNMQVAEGLKAMALDLTALNAAVAKVSGDVDTLISEAGSTPQSAIDTVTANVLAVSDKAEKAIAALNPPPPVQTA